MERRPAKVVSGIHVSAFLSQQGCQSDGMSTAGLQYIEKKVDNGLVSRSRGPHQCCAADNTARVNNRSRVVDQHVQDIVVAKISRIHEPRPSMLVG